MFELCRMAFQYNKMLFLVLGTFYHSTLWRIRANVSFDVFMALTLGVEILPRIWTKQWDSATVIARTSRATWTLMSALANNQATIVTLWVGLCNQWMVYHWCTVIIAALKLGRELFLGVQSNPPKACIPYPEPARVTQYWSGTHQSLQDSAVCELKQEGKKPAGTSFCSVIWHHVLVWLHEVSDNNSNLETKLNVRNPHQKKPRVCWHQVITPYVESDDSMIP